MTTVASRIRSIDRRLLGIFISCFAVRLVYQILTPGAVDWITFAQLGESAALNPMAFWGVYTVDAYFMAPFFLLWKALTHHSAVGEFILYGTPPIPWVSFRPSFDGYFMIFMMKLPALVFDVIAALLIIKIVWNSHSVERARWATAAWFLSPLTLITIGFNSFDIVPATLTLIAVYFFSKNRLILSSLTFAMSTAMRLFPLMILPVLLLRLIRGGDWRAFLRMVLPGALALLAFAMPILARDPDQVLGYLKGGISQFQFLPEAIDFQGANLPLIVGIIPVNTIALVAMLYPVIAVFVSSPRRTFSDVAWQSYAVLLAYVGFAWSSPSFLVWLLPFLFAYVSAGENHRVHTILLSISGFLWSIVRSPGYIFARGTAFLYIPASNELLATITVSAYSFTNLVLNNFSIMIRGALTAGLVFLLIRLMRSQNVLSAGVTELIGKSHTSPASPDYSKAL